MNINLGGLKNKDINCILLVLPCFRRIYVEMTLYVVEYLTIFYGSFLGNTR